MSPNPESDPGLGVGGIDCGWRPAFTVPRGSSVNPLALPAYHRVGFVSMRPRFVQGPGWRANSACGTATLTGRDQRETSVR